jgi:hypothetical protein
MDLPSPTSVDGMYQYMIGLLLVLVVVFGLFFGAAYFGLL